MPFKTIKVKPLSQTMKVIDIIVTATPWTHPFDIQKKDTMHDTNISYS